MELRGRRDPWQAQLNCTLAAGDRDSQAGRIEVADVVDALDAAVQLLQVSERRKNALAASVGDEIVRSIRHLGKHALRNRERPRILEHEHAGSWSEGFPGERQGLRQAAQHSEG
jgi:hypothetical protein